MSALPTSSGQGALFELVARGVKDRYFVREDQSTFVFDARYGTSVAHLAERRVAIPVNGTTFGGTFEVELDKYGDVLTECALEIDLPSWYPPLPIQSGGMPLEPRVACGLYPITAVGTGESYGYVNGVGYFLLERVQFYQDQILLQEWSGDGLLAQQLTEDTYTQSFLRQEKAGLTGEGLRELQRRAVPGRLRIYLPVPGTQRPGDMGFPLVSMPWQNFRFRVTLRRLEDIVVAWGGERKPLPWRVSAFQYTMEDGVHTFAPVMPGQPSILLSTVQRYVTAEAQEELRRGSFQIPFRRVFENQFTLGELDYISLDKGGVAAVTRRLEARHPVERLFWFFRSSVSVDTNHLDTWQNALSDGSWYQRLKFVIAGRDRESLESGEVWQDMVPWVKDDRVNQRGVGSMRWSLGDRMGRAPGDRQPEGTVNFSTADRPTLYLELTNVPVDPMRAERLVEWRVFAESWMVYVIKGGRGQMMFAS